MGRRRTATGRLMLLSRGRRQPVLGRRYLERAEDTARIVRAYTELIVDLPTAVSTCRGSRCSRSPATSRRSTRRHDARRASRRSCTSSSPTRRTRAASSAASRQARENLRTTREVMPREAWQAVNDLSLYVAAATRRRRPAQPRRFLARVDRRQPAARRRARLDDEPRRARTACAASASRSSAPT